METWGMAQLYHFIQRAAQQAERLHSELQQRCEQQQQQIIVLTEYHEHLTTAHRKLQDQMNEVARVFMGLWLAVKAHYTLMPADVPETDVLQREIHLRVAYTSLH